MGVSMSEVYSVENDEDTGKQQEISGNDDNGENMTSFPSISNDTQAMSVADERKSNVSSTEIRSGENAVEQHMSPTYESESHAVIRTDLSNTSDNLNPAKKLNRQGELMLCSSFRPVQPKTNSLTSSLLPQLLVIFIQLDIFSGVTSNQASSQKLNCF